MAREREGEENNQQNEEEEEEERMEDGRIEEMIMRWEKIWQNNKEEGWRDRKLCVHTVFL